MSIETFHKLSLYCNIYELTLSCHWLDTIHNVGCIFLTSSFWTSGEKSEETLVVWKKKSRRQCGFREGFKKNLKFKITCLRLSDLKHFLFASNIGSKLSRKKEKSVKKERSKTWLCIHWWLSLEREVLYFRKMSIFGFEE